MPDWAKKFNLSDAATMRCGRRAYNRSRNERIVLSIRATFCDNVNRSLTYANVMMKQSNSIFFALMAALVLAVSAAGQTSSFSSPDVEYGFELPDERWKMTVKPSATTPNVEYVFGDRTDGHFEVRKLGLPSRGVLSELIRDEEQKLQFMPGYVAGKEEQFGGFLKGVVFNFEFVRAGRPMSGRFYYLRVDNSTVYVLRFTGFRDRLRSIRNQTDSIARTFNVKKK